MSMSTSGPGGTLDKNAFLKLMLAQMQNQNPLKPQDNTQFVAQLAQFTSLEQMTNLATTSTQALFVNQLSLEQRLLGQTVTVQNPDQSTVTGPVSSIRVENGQPNLVVGGQSYALTDIVQMGGSGK